MPICYRKSYWINNVLDQMAALAKEISIYLKGSFRGFNTGSMWVSLQEACSKVSVYQMDFITLNTNSASNVLVSFNLLVKLRSQPSAHEC